ncbi:unnamed protein product [Pseudo-nitzschia multistriata]|uniref:Uncharacterized protein n=1 Tax=Pseudo-nitzschia multistriata TaxID=183589 RepID=A0A448Z3V3_9STRA|nr:unnamed protein product [Pseudo-nitzschia multistriata]
MERDRPPETYEDLWARHLTGLNAVIAELQRCPSKVLRPDEALQGQRALLLSRCKAVMGEITTGYFREYGHGYRKQPWPQSSAERASMGAEVQRLEHRILYELYPSKTLLDRASVGTRARAKASIVGTKATADVSTETPPGSREEWLPPDAEAETAATATKTSPRSTHTPQSLWIRCSRFVLPITAATIAGIVFARTVTVGNFVVPRTRTTT